MSVSDVPRSLESWLSTTHRSYSQLTFFIFSNFELVFVSRNPPDSSKEICYGDLVTEILLRRFWQKLPHTLIPIVFVKLCPPRTDGSFLARDTSTHTPNLAPCQVSFSTSTISVSFGAAIRWIVSSCWYSRNRKAAVHWIVYAGIHVIETAAKVVAFAAVLCSIPVPVPGTWYVL